MHTSYCMNMELHAWSLHLTDTGISCRWEILEQVLRLIDSWDTLEEYKRLVSQDQHILNVLPGGVLAAWSSSGLNAPAIVGTSPRSAEHQPQGVPPPGANSSSQAVRNSSDAGVLSLREDNTVELKHTD